MKHILIVFTGEFATKLNPLDGIFQIDHALALKNQNFKVGIIAPGLLSLRKILKKKNYKKYEMIKGIPILREIRQNFLPMTIGINNKIISKYYEKMGLNLFEKYVKHFGKPDIIHTNDVRFGIFVAHNIQKKYKIPFVTTQHSSDLVRNQFPDILKKRAISILKKSKVVTTCSANFSKIFKKYFNLKNTNVQTINPVLPVEFENTKFRKRKNKKFTFISVNRLDKNKNIRFILESFMRGFHNKDVILKIIGDGPDKKNLQKFIRTKNMQKKILLKGFLNRAKIKKELITSDCFLSASKHETFGVAIIEALSMGLPVISTKAEGPSTIINKKNGFLINHYDKKNFLEKMKRIYNGKSKFNSNHIRKNTIKRFGEKSFVLKLKKIYKDSINA